MYVQGLTMPTTTIRLDDDLKERISAAADLAGKTAHAFIVDAIARTVDQVEAEEELHRIAEKRWAKLLVTGNSVPWDDAKKYLAARGRGERPVKPTARKLEHRWADDAD
jgi:predicted transcriptional regulator